MTWRPTWRPCGWNRFVDDWVRDNPCSGVERFAIEDSADAILKGAVEYLCKLEKEKDYLCLDHIIRELGAVTE